MERYELVYITHIACTPVGFSFQEAAAAADGGSMAPDFDDLATPAEVDEVRCIHRKPLS